jgi:hypothetical protein
MSSSIRLRLATRIHFALLRHFDEKVDVETLLRGGDETQEALWVCDASGDVELIALARAFRKANQNAKPERPTGFGSTDFGVSGFATTEFATTEFASTEFGETSVAELVDERPAARGSWFGKLNALLPR